MKFILNIHSRLLFFWNPLVWHCNFGDFGTVWVGITLYTFILCIFFGVFCCMFHFCRLPLQLLELVFLAVTAPNSFHFLTSFLVSSLPFYNFVFPWCFTKEPQVHHILNCPFILRGADCLVVFNEEIEFSTHEYKKVAEE